MMQKKSVKVLFIIINLFLPGSLNIVSGKLIAGSIIFTLSLVTFSLSPYLGIDLLRILHLLALILSYSYFFIGGISKLSNDFNKYILLCILIALSLSVFSISNTNSIISDRITKSDDGIIFVLGTKPFKHTSTKKMFSMSDKELFNLYNNDIHPFFRRLKTGIHKAREHESSLLVISAGKNQKKITQKILNQLNMDGVFLSCKSTKEEIAALKKYIEDNTTESAGVIIVSDDYHAFRVLQLSKLYDLDSVKFLGTSYEYSFSSFLKIYCIELLQYLFSYVTFGLSLIKNFI